MDTSILMDLSMAISEKVFHSQNNVSNYNLLLHFNHIKLKFSIDLCMHSSCRPN